MKFITIDGSAIEAHEDEIIFSGKVMKGIHWGWWVVGLLFFWPILFVFLIMPKTAHYYIQVRDINYEVDREEYYAVQRMKMGK